jgi:hypothetical protein
MLPALLAKGDSVENVVLGDLVAQLDRSAASVLRVRFSGRSANREAGKVLAPLFDRVLGEVKAEPRALALHFEGLEYFNSATIAALVPFIRTVLDAGVGLTVVYDGRQRWQAMTFEALRRAHRPIDGFGVGPTVEFTAA